MPGRVLIAGRHGGDLNDQHIFGGEYLWVHFLVDQIWCQRDHGLRQG